MKSLKLNSEKVTKALLWVASLVIVIVSAGMVLSLASGAIPAFKEFGLNFIISTDWNPTEGRENYGAMPFIAGTILTSIIALVICLPLSFSTALFIGEYFKGKRIAIIVGGMVDMLAGIPSIVYGLWGFYVLRPLIVEMGFNSQGYGVFTAGLILAIMIIPYATSITTEIFKMVPHELKEAAYSLGATRVDVIFSVLIPNSSSGIVTSYILAFGRAIGETMAVTMLIGNTNVIPDSIFGTGNTMASVIANQFGEADGLKLSALIAIALLLFVLTGLINALGKIILKRYQ